MKPTAIVYTSNTGHTAEYAKLLGEKTGLKVYSMAEAAQDLAKGTPIFYLGWLFASSVKGYKKAAKKYKICAVCGVGLCDIGTLPDEERMLSLLQKGGNCVDVANLSAVLDYFHHSKE